MNSPHEISSKVPLAGLERVKGWPGQSLGRAPAGRPHTLTHDKRERLQMTTLELQTPAETHLEKNAKPTIAAILQTTHQIEDACASFGPVNDNRACINDLAQNLLTLSVDLLDVHSLDAVELAKAVEFNAYLARLRGGMKILEQWAVSVFSDDASAQYPLKIFKQSVRNVRRECSLFSEVRDNRDAIAQAVEQMQNKLSDFCAMVPNADKWGPNGLSQASANFLVILHETIRTAPEVTPEGQPRNERRDALADALDDYSKQLSWLAVPGDVLVSERETLLADARQIRRDVLREPYSAISDQQELANRVRQIQERAASIEKRIPLLPASRLKAVARDNMPWSKKHCEIVLQMLNTEPSEATDGAKSLLSRLGRAFGWEE